MLKRIKRITSHTGHARYFAACPRSGDTIGWIPRQDDIPSPYAYSPDHRVFRSPDGVPVIIVETRHKTYDVFAIGDTKMYAKSSDATNTYISSKRAAAGKEVVSG